jgi:putative peptidoglycan lipid II flippase
VTPFLRALRATVGNWASASTNLVAGHLVEVLLLVTWLARSGFRVRHLWPTLDRDSRFVLSQYLPMVAGGLLMVSTQIVDQAMAAMLPAGSIAALSYGNKIMAVPLNVAVTALGTAATPYLSALVAQHDAATLHRTVMRYVRLSVLGSLLPAAGLAAAATPLVRILFERGAFSSHDTEGVAGVQALACLQIPFHVAGAVLVRAISALSANRVFVWGNILNLTVNVTHNLVFMRRLGVAGIALSTSAMYIASFTYLSISYSRRMAAWRGQEAPGCA